MAKKEHQEQVTGGLSESVLDGLKFTSGTGNEELGGANKTKGQAANGSTLAGGYKELHKGKMETRSVKLNILITPSTADKLNNAVKEEKIKSKADLINYLLERYFEDEEHRG